MLVRVIDYAIDDGHDDGRGDGGKTNETKKPVTYRLFTTLLDPEQAPALELATAYTQRWEIESAFDELKTHQHGPRVVLRSKSPDLVLQEIWGHLCCHYAIRSLMSQAAQHAGHDPDRSSFTTALRIVRQTIAHQGAFPPQQHKARKDDHSTVWRTFPTRLLPRLNPARRYRPAPRVVKRKYTKWHVKRATHATWPQPSDDPAPTITSCQLNGIATSPAL